MNTQILDPAPKKIIKFSGFKENYYEFVFYHDFQVEMAHRLINHQDRASLIDLSSMVSEQ